MKKIKILVIVSMLLMALLVPTSAFATEVPNGYGSFTTNGITTTSPIVNVTVDGFAKSFPDTSAHIRDNRTLVPVRFISEELGAMVTWNENIENGAKVQTITITKDGKNIVMVIGKTTYKSNGISKQMDTTPLLVNGRTMVPLRFVSDDLGVTVSWNQISYTAEISTGDILPLPTDDFDVWIQEEIKTNSSLGNIYKANPTGTKTFISDLTDMKKLISFGGDSDGAYITLAGQGAAGSIIMNPADKRSYMFINQSDRKSLSFDATWIILTSLFSESDATKVWYSIGDMMAREQKSDFAPSTGTITGYKYSVEGYSPNGVFIYIDKR